MRLWMRQFGSTRSRKVLVLISLVIAVQISLNITLTQHDCGHQRHRFTDIRLSMNQDMARELQQTQDALLALRQEFNLSQAMLLYRIKELVAENQKLRLEIQSAPKVKKIINGQDFAKFKNEIRKSSFLKDDYAKSLNDVVPFDSFTVGGIYTTNHETPLDRPSMRPTGTRYIEHLELMKFSLNALNSEPFVQQKLTYQNIDGGITRLDRLNGMVYNLFVTGSKPLEYHRVKVRRPFSNLEIVDHIETIDTSKETINIIVPLSGRIKKFQIFLKRFADVGIRYDARVFLTVVYFGEKGRKKAQEMLTDMEIKENFTSYHFITVDGPFSRGVGLQRAVDSWTQGNNIMFFCDVDVYFTPSFLERCRMYSEQERMVYYPIVYSLYNPDIVYDSKPPEIEKQFYIGKDNGFWRDYGFGMTCVYKNDFLATKGFDKNIQGWGTEDIQLFKKFLTSANITVIRATDRGIFHLYHPKNCDPVLSPQQYVACLKSKTLNEGNHKQMGMLAFGPKLFSNLKPDWKSRMLYKPDFSRRDRKMDEKANLFWKKADELDIEAVEIKMLRNRLTQATNFTLLARNLTKFEKIDLSMLEDLEGNIIKQSDLFKRFATKLTGNRESTNKLKDEKTT